MADSNDLAFASAFDEMRDLIRADGGDLRVTSVEGATVHIELILETANCADCVMPRQFLERVALDVFRANEAGVDVVAIDDPREQQGPTE